MNKIKEKKKLFIIVVIISLIAILLGSYAIYKNSNKDETANKIEKSEKLEKKAEKKLKEAKKSGNKEEIAKAEKELKEAEEKTEEIKKDKTGNSSKANTPSASSSNASTSKSTPTASKPSASSSSGASSTSKPSPKPKEKKQVWVVDKPAWTETVKEPIYSERNVWYASNWDNSKSAKFYSYEECDAWLDTVAEGMGGYQETTEDYISGYNTKTINHPEQGHWEYR